MAEPGRLLHPSGYRRTARSMARIGVAEGVSRRDGVPARNAVPGGVARALAASGRRLHDRPAEGTGPAGQRTDWHRPEEAAPQQPDRARGMEAAGEPGAAR